MSGANLKEKDFYVDFLYSEQQNKERSEIEKKMSRVFSPGTVIVNGIKRRIYRGTKARNPDGTVNYTKLELV